MYNRKIKQLTKKPKFKIVEISSDFPDVDLSRELTNFVKDKKPRKIKDPERRFNDFWIKDLLPKWQGIWNERGVDLKYNRNHCCFYLTSLRSRFTH